MPPLGRGVSPAASVVSRVVQGVAWGRLLVMSPFVTQAMPHRQQFKGPVQNVALNDLHVHQYWPDSMPPDDAAASLQCWQCRRLTWRYTALCMHCRVSLRRGFWMAKWRELKRRLSFQARPI